MAWIGSALTTLTHVARTWDRYPGFMLRFAVEFV